MSNVEKLITLLKRYESEVKTSTVTIQSSVIDEMLVLSKQIKDEQTTGTISNNG